MNTTRQVHDNELLRPYLPQDLLDYDGPVKRQASADDESLARARAFHDAIAPESEK